MRFNVSQEEIEKSASTMPEGEWSARVDMVKTKKSEKGNSMILIRWKCTDTDGEAAGTSCLENLVMIPEAFWKLKEVFDATGFRAEPDGFDSDDLLGLECKIVVTNREYEGKTRPNVDQHLPL